MSGAVTINFEQAKLVALKSLRYLEAILMTEVIIVDSQCEEYEWGWMISTAPKDIAKVPAEELPWSRRYVIVDRVTAKSRDVGSSGPRLAIMALLEERPPGFESRFVHVEDLGGLKKVRVSMQAFVPLKDLHLHAEKPEDSIE